MATARFTLWSHTSGAPGRRSRMTYEIREEATGRVVAHPRAYAEALALLARLNAAPPDAQVQP